jgi:alpha-D-glucose phosphate-specific phosphoglucomutase
MIRFGTSGWRGVIADDFTIVNVRRVASAIARTLQDDGLAKKGVFVGYDTRFLSDRFAQEVAGVLAAHGIPVRVSPSPVPTPAVAFAIVSGRRAAGINITASHNPPDYSGLKLSTAEGAPALPRVTQRIERLVNSAASRKGASTARGKKTRRPRTATIQKQDVRAAYFKHLGTLVRFPAIRKARLKLACDPRHGASIGFLDGILGRVSKSVEVIHGAPHPEFGVAGPDCGEKQLKPLARQVRRGRLHLGLATDGDGDRFGIVDAGGTFISPNLFLAVLADYLLEHRRLPGGVGRSVATTHLLDRVCARYDRPLYETPVGFKFLGEHLMSGRAFLVCEESAGMSLLGHLPEKDGILAGLLAAEMVAVRKRSLRDQIRDLYKKVGPLHSRRIDYHTDAATRERLMRRLEEAPADFAGKRTMQTDLIDGRRLLFDDGSWALFRPSGTEPLIRCYLEARSPKELDALAGAARDLIMRS